MALSAKDLLKKLKENTLDKTTLDERLVGVAKRYIPAVGAVSMANKAINAPRPDVSRFAPQYNQLRNALQQPAPQFLQKPYEMAQSFNNSVFGAPGRVVMGKSNSALGRWIQGYQGAVQDSVSKAGQSFDKNFSQIEQGQTLKQRLPTIASGGWNTAKALSQVTPKELATMAIPSVIGGVVAKLQGQDPFIGAGRSSGESQGWRPVLNVTDPLTARTSQKAVQLLTNRGASRLARIPLKRLAIQQMAQRATTGIGNTIEDEILDRLDQRQRTNADRLASFAIGSAMGGNSQLLDQAKKRLTDTDIKQVAKELNVSAEKVKQVYQDGLGRILTYEDDTGKVFTKSGLTKQEASDWSAWAESMGYKWSMGIGGGSPGKIGTSKPPTDPLESLKQEARKYKSAEEFVKAQGTPKTIKLWFKSKFSDSGSYSDVPVIRKVENKTLYQGGDDGRQFWTPDKKYAAQFGDVKEKTGSFYQVENGNKMTEVFVDADKTKSQLTDIYNQSQLPKSKVEVVNQTAKEKIPVLSETKTGTTQSRVPLVNAPQPLMSQGKQVDQLLQLKKQPKKLLLNDQVRVQSQALDNIIAEGRRSIGSVKQEPGRPVKQVLNDLYTQWVDRYHPLSRASKQAKNILKVKGAELRPEYDPDYLVRRLTGAGGIADQRFNTELKPIIDEIDQLGIPKLDMDTYLAHKRMAGFGDVGREIIGADPVKSKRITTALEAKYPEISQLADQLYKYQDQGLQELVDAGFISPDAVKTIRSQNPDYAPLYRVMDEMDEYLGLPTRKTMQGKNPVVKIKGSKRQIESPIESIIGNTFRQRAAIEKNRVAQSIIGLNKVSDMGFNKVAKSGNDTITVWNNGKKEYWQVGSDIADVAKGVNEEVTNTLLKVIQAPAQLLRQGATGRNPAFMIPNIVRDQLDAGITSKYGYIPFVDYVSGLKSMLKNDAVYQRWQNSGAKIDLGELSGKKSITKLFDEKKSKKRLYQWITDGLDVMGKYSEQPTRVGLFKKAYQKTGNELLSAMESRDATVDFARMGSKMKVANSIIPFLNVGVQGFDKLARAIKNNPKKVLLNMGIYGATPAIAVTAYNLQNFPREYEEIPQYEKDSNFVIVKGRNAEGVVDYFTIPKGNIVPVVANPIQSFMEYLAGVDGKSFSELAVNLVSETLPVLEGGNTPREVLVKTTGSMIPQFAKPIIEDITNKSFYKYDAKKEAQGKESGVIVPSYLKEKEPYQQTYEFTPQVYQKIGAVLNVSPLRIKNLMEGYLAGYAKIPVQITEMMNAISKGEPISPNDKTVLSRFVKQTYSSSSTQRPVETKDTPGLMDRVTGKADASTAPVSIPTDQETFNELYKDASSKSKYLEKYNAIQYDPTLDDTQKQEKISKLRDEASAWGEVLAKMERENPEMVFTAQIETYKTGSGKSVDERSEWVYKKLETAQDEKELQSWINRLWEEKVLTTGSSGVAQYLEDTYGIKLKYTGTNKKIKAKSAKKIKLGSTPQMKSPMIKFSAPQGGGNITMNIPKLNIQMPKTNRVKVRPSIDLRKVRFV